MLAHVPYRNSPQSIADVAAGHVAMAFAEAGASLPLIRDGKLRALAVTSSTRLPTVPDLPPFGEAVGAPDFETVSWHVLLAPAGTPPEVVDRLHGEMKRIMEAPEMRKKVADIGLIPHRHRARRTPDARYIKAEGEKWGTLVRKLGLQGSQWRPACDRSVQAPNRPHSAPLGSHPKRHGQTANGRTEAPCPAALPRRRP